MNTIKKTLALFLTLAMLVSLVACAPTEEAVAEGDEQGKVLNIYCWNEEFKSRFTDYFETPGLVPDKTPRQMTRLIFSSSKRTMHLNMSIPIMLWTL